MGIWRSTPLPYEQIIKSECLKGRSAPDTGRITRAEKPLFEENFKIPSFAITNLESTTIYYKRFNSMEEMELEKYGKTGAYCSCPIPETCITVSGEIGTKNYNETQTTRSSQIDSLVIYIPKATILFQAIQKRLSKEAKTFFLTKQVTLRTVIDFFNKFGLFIPTEVTIGGKAIVYRKIAASSDVMGNEREISPGIGVDFDLFEKKLNVGLGTRGSWETERRNTTEIELVDLDYKLDGGIANLLSDPLKWIASLDNPANWRVIQFRHLKYTYEYLDKGTKDKFETQFQRLRHLRTKPRSHQLLIYSFSSCIRLKGFPDFLLVFDDKKLFIFFNRALQVLLLDDLKTNIKVPLPWEKLRSATTFDGLIYASTSEGLMSLNPDTFEVKTVIEIKNFPMCLILANDHHLYAFNNEVQQVKPTTGSVVHFPNMKAIPNEWRNAWCGFSNNKCFCILLDNRRICELDYVRNSLQINKKWRSNLEAIAHCKKFPNDTFLFQQDISRVNKADSTPIKICEGEPHDDVRVATSKDKLYVATQRKKNHQTCSYPDLAVIDFDGNRTHLSLEWTQLGIFSI